jgi:hypothetical protein
MGIVMFFALVIGGPIGYHMYNIPQTCHDNLQNHGESSIDRGGPCLLLDERTLLPYSVVWARALPVRDGTYNAVAYVNNPNPSAGVLSADYTFRVYDNTNVLLGERTGTTFIMPGGVTPILVTGMDTGNRTVTRTYFAFTKPLVWHWMHTTVQNITVNNTLLTHTDTAPFLSAIMHNTDAHTNTNIQVIAIVFDTVGNALGASKTLVSTITGYQDVPITFTWPVPFTSVVGSVEVLPIKEPIEEVTAER